jgi:hypothetical protein
MTQPTVLELAKQGDPQAIATLMNRTLHTQGMNARVARQGDRLLIMTEADHVPNRMVMTNFVRNGINGLELDSIRLIRILGKKTGDDQAAWVQEIEMGNGQAPPPPPPPAEATLAPEPPPVIRPLPPPPPPLVRPISDPPPSSGPVEAPPPKRLPPPPPPPLTGLSPRPSADLDDEVASFISDDTTVLPELDEDFANSAINLDLDLNGGDSIDLDLRPAAEDPAAESLIDDLFNAEASAGADTDLDLDDEEISLALDEVDHDLLGLSDAALDDLVAQTEAPPPPSEAIAPPPVETPASPPPPPFADDDDLSLVDSSDLDLDDLDEDGDAPALLPPSPPPPALPPDTDEAAQGSRFNAGTIFGVILSLIVAWIAGMIGYNAWQTMGEGDTAETPGTEAVPIPAEDAPAATEDAYSNAIALAAQAERLEDEAQTPEDWDDIATQWQQAIDALQAVPEDDPNHAAAQTALPDYQAALVNAQQQATPVRVANASACRAVQSTPESPPLELTNVQFNAPTDNAQITFIVGCITNHTDQVIGNVSITYQAIAGEAGISDEGRLNFNDLAPGQTIPFRSDFTLSPTTTEATIDRISWAVVGATTPQQLDASIQLER